MDLSYVDSDCFSSFVQYERKVFGLISDQIGEDQNEDYEKVYNIHKAITRFVTRERWEKTTLLGKIEYFKATRLSYESWTLSSVFGPF